MSISDRLSDVRSKVGMTQEQFAGALGVSRVTYVNYERGNRDLPSSLILGLYESFSIDPTWLLTGEAAMTSEIKKGLVSAAISAVQSFSIEKNLQLMPEEMAKLVLLLVEYFEQVGRVDLKFADKMLELQT